MLKSPVLFACAMLLLAPAPAIAQAPSAPVDPNNIAEPPKVGAAGVTSLPDTVFAPASSYVGKLAATRNGQITVGLPASMGTTLGIVRRDAVGLVDIHGKWNEQFVILSGTAEMRVGGRLRGARQTGPDEWRGGAIEGGETYQVGPGDVIWVKAGVPHQMVPPPGGEIRYYIFKDQTTAKP